MSKQDIERLQGSINSLIELVKLVDDNAHNLSDSLIEESAEAAAFKKYVFERIGRYQKEIYCMLEDYGDE